MAECLTKRYADQIKGVLHCFDRLVFHGSFREIEYPGAMEGHLRQHGVLFIDYQKRVANELRLEMTAHVKAVAALHKMDITFLNRAVRKEAHVAKQLAKRGKRSGVVSVISAMESCRCYKTQKDERTGFLCLQNSPGKCLHYYIYIMDEELGLCYLRIPTWAPFRLQFYFNGHDRLERQLKENGISYKKNDNAFVHISDFKRANELAANLDPDFLAKKFNDIARKWVSVFDRFHGHLRWSILQAELATDMVFKNSHTLPSIYDDIVRTAICDIKCRDVYQFLGRRDNKRSQEQPEGRLQTLVEGTRIKHTLKSSSIKMYDKGERVLRIETTTSDVSSFKCYRSVVSRDGTLDPRRAPILKDISSLPVLRETLQGCNERYLGAISQMEDRADERHKLDQIVHSKKDSAGRSFRGVNFFLADDLLFLRAILQGEHNVLGLRNRSLKPWLPGWKAQKIGRNLRRFRALGLLKKVAFTTKYYVTKLGNDMLVAALQLRERIVLPALKTS
jgi:hypothetical protein